jgi:hypothetical protein
MGGSPHYMRTSHRISVKLENAPGKQKSYTMHFVSLTVLSIFEI